jgi:Tol biopolymer transport system component
MALAVGARLGPYEIRSLIGSGGMGEVYRAHDPKLKRDVALKILPEHTAADPERRARFEREAQSLAALSHPNIVTIHSVEQADGLLFLTMECVEGTPLNDLIAKGGLPLPRILALAIPLADAVTAAHDKGITHRDLKPANVMVTADSRVKVLDFGLAKLVEPAPAEALATMMPTAAVSSEGRIVGTVAYMSPEQAEGKRIDARSDIFSLGVLLYEMATGERPFTGETPVSTITSILRDTPRAITDLNRALPRDLALIVRRCLAKDPEHRTQSAKDLRNQLEDLKRTLDSGELSAPATMAGMPTPIHAGAVARRERVAWSIAAIALVAFVAGSLWILSRPVPALPIVRFEVATATSSDPTSFALSPDGGQLVFAAAAGGASTLWVRRLDDTTAHPLAGTEGALHPFWKPDGRSIGFFANGKLKVIDVAGGSPRELANASGGRGGAWNSDDVILYTPANALATPDSVLMRIPATGGTPTAVTHLTGGDGSHRWPQFLPDGHRFIFLSAFGPPERNGIFLGSLDGGDPVRLTAADSPALFAPPDTLLIMRQGVLRAVTFDPERGTVTGDGVPVVDVVGTDIGIGRSAFSVANTGALAYRATGGTERRQLAWVDRTGKRVLLGEPDDTSMASPRLDPTGRRVVVPRFEGGNRDVWVMDLVRGDRTRLTFDSAGDASPIWSADGRAVIFQSVRDSPASIFEMSTSGVGAPRLVLRDTGVPLSASHDGRFLLYQRQDQKTGTDLWVLPLGDEQKPYPLVPRTFDERGGDFSPDGRWIAYESNESGRFEIYVRSFPGDSSKVPVSIGGGTQPRWRRDSREIYYVAPDARMMAVSITVSADGQTLEASAPLPLFPTRLATGAGFAPGEQQYAVAPDGRFLVNTVVDEAKASPITVVLNWTAALKK